MAFAVAGQMPSLAEWLPSPPVSDRAVMFPTIHARNASAPSNNTINMFIDAPESDYAYAASIVTACADQTVFAIRCTSGPPLAAGTCGPNAAVATLTSGSKIYALSSAFTTRTQGVQVTITAEETCNLAGTTAATCSATVKGTASTSTTTVSSTETLSGSTYYRFDVAITGGAEKTASATGTCGAKSAASSVHSKNFVLWGLACVSGAVMIFSSM